MNPILKDNINDIEELCKLHKVRQLYAFGSVCTDKFNDKSDIDLLISFENLPVKEYTDNYFALHYLFEKLFKHPVDLLTDNSLSNPYFIEGLEKTKTLLYGVRS
jgi:predicted nucleotidyltransferase